MKRGLAAIFSKIFVLFFKLRYGRHIIFGKDVIVNHRFRFLGKGTLIIGDQVNLWAHKEPNDFQTYSEKALITIGKNSRINGATIQCRISVAIGEHCLIGSAMIMDHDFHSVFFEKRNDPSAIKAAPIIIEDKVWIAGQSAILKGVMIGREAVVGFRALVTKSIPERTVAAGNPARVVKTLAEKIL